MDILFEVLAEIFLEGYLALLKILIPRHKMTARKAKILEWIAAALTVAVLFAFVAGIALLVENGKSPLGLGLLIGSLVVFFGQLLFGIIYAMK